MLGLSQPCDLPASRASCSQRKTLDTRSQLPYRRHSRAPAWSYVGQSTRVETAWETRWARLSITCSAQPRSTEADNEETLLQGTSASGDSSVTSSRPAGPVHPGEGEAPCSYHAPAAPEVTLVTKLRVGQAKQQFWSDFMGKCRLAWDVFFPGKPQVLSPRGAGKSRLQMIIVSDRCGLDLPTLMEMKNSSMAALAAQHGWQDMTEMELQVASIKPSGERIHMTLPLSSLPSADELRDSDDYVFESLAETSGEEEETDKESLLVERGASRTA